MRRRRVRLIVGALLLVAVLVLLAHPLAGADVFSNVGPGESVGGLAERYPSGNYSLDQHFTFVDASITGGVDVSGVPPMIAYFLAEILWSLTSFLAELVITLFTFAFSLDLLNGSAATGGAGALRPVSAAIHSIYAHVFGAPWLVLAISIVGMWAMWRGLLQRRYIETAGALAMSLVYLVIALAFVAQPGRTVGSASGPSSIGLPCRSNASVGCDSSTGSPVMPVGEAIFAMYRFCCPSVVPGQPDHTK